MTEFGNFKASISKGLSGICDGRFWMWVTIVIIGAVVYGVLAS